MSETLAAQAAPDLLSSPTRAKATLRSSILVRRALLVGAPVLAGLFAVLGAAFDPAAGISGGEMWKLYAENPDPLQWKSFGLHWSFTFWALPALGAWGFIRSRGAWFANVAGLFGIVGIAMVPGMLIVDFYDSVIGRVAGIGTVEQVHAAFDGMWAVSAMVLPGNIALLLSMPLAAAAFWRAGIARWWSLVAVVAGNTALWFSGFLWWGAAIFTITAIVFAVDLAMGLRRSDRTGFPSA